MIVYHVQVFLLGLFVGQWSTQAQEHIGCFRTADLNHVLQKNTFIVGVDEMVMTIDKCIARCIVSATTYAGIYKGHECRCGDNHEHEVNGPRLNDSSCTAICPGDNQTKCGDTDSIVIYSVCNHNRYRNITNGQDNCDASCHCMDLQACTYSSGLCPAGCEPGWSSDACNIRNFTFVEDDRTLMTDALTLSVSTGITAYPTTALVSPSGAHPDDHSDHNNNVNNPATAIAVGVSVAFVCLVVIAAFIVYLRKRRLPRKSDDSPVEAVSIPEVTVGDIHNKDDLAMEQPDNGEPSSSSPALNYSPVVFENHSQPRDDGKDIAKSDDDIVIHDDQEKVEYAVSMRPKVTRHANLKDNSLYGTYSDDMDDHNYE